VYSKKKEQGGCITNKERELSGKALETFIRQQKVNNDIVEKLPPVLRSDASTELFNVSQTLSYETDLPSTRVDKPITALLDYGDSIKKGNPLIQSILPINFQVELLVKDTTTNELLNGLDLTLENHIQTEYQKLIDLDNTENKNTDGISNSASKTLKLGEVDLTLSLVESKWWQERRWRRLGYNSTSSMSGSLRSGRRDMQEGGQSSNTKLMTISVNGSVNYSMEVDGSVPTPDDIETQWREAYFDITSQSQLQRAIEIAGIEGVIRLEQVTTEDSSDQSNNELPADTTKVTNDSVGNGSDNGDDKDNTNNENVASLYEDDTDENDKKSSGINVEGNDNEKNSLEKLSQLERPSTLSIVFGFILTGIAVLGLVAYAYIFYRKRQKRLKKKRKMKESITFSSASAAVATATYASKRTQNSQYYSKNTSQSAPPPVEAQHPSQMRLNSTMLSQSESEETSYKGIESSIGSEDISDSFASELKLAASLDQEAWNESQRRKENLEKREVTRVGYINPMLSKNRNSSISAPVPSLLSNGPMSLEEEEDEIDVGAIEADLEGTTSWVKSSPYGDEAQTVRGINDDESGMPSSSNQWEPYNSVLPPLIEEKKDEISPSEFFSQKLKIIKNDLTVSRGQPADTSHIEANITDDNASTSDILSEVSELSRYVRRYERRKDRKIKREEYFHERLSVGEGASSHSSSPKTMSIGMDGRVYEARSSTDCDRPTPSSTTRMQPNTLSSYAESYGDAQKHEMSILESMSFVSDGEDDAEDTSMRSQRLGISPYRRSNDEVCYKNGNLRNEDNSSSSSRTRSTRPLDDYRYSVGYSQDHSKSSVSRLADLRANDAIIDNANSEVNLNHDISTMPDDAINDDNKNSWSVANKGSGMARLNFRRVNKSKNTEAIISAATQQQSNNSRAPTNNNRFDKLRGMFVQTTHERPEPIYPPGENWQFGGSSGK